MGKFANKFWVAALCTIISCTSANASSVLISNMTLLGIKPATSPYILSGRKHGKNTIKQIVELRCLALALYHEARGEPVLGQYAVGATILNRVRSEAYPNTICGVVYQNEHQKYRCQFSFACDDISDSPQNRKSFLKMQRLSKTILQKGMSREAKYVGLTFEAEANNMTHYHRLNVTPIWSKELEQLSTLGAHVFFKSTRVTKRYAY